MTELHVVLGTGAIGRAIAEELTGRGSDFLGPWGTGSTMGERVFYPLLKGKAASLVGRVDLPHTASS